EQRAVQLVAATWQSSGCQDCFSNKASLSPLVRISLPGRSLRVLEKGIDLGMDQTLRNLEVPDAPQQSGIRAIFDLVIVEDIRTLWLMHWAPRREQTMG